MIRKKKNLSLQEDDKEVRLRELEIDHEVEKRISKWIRTICITATGSFLTFCGWLGGIVYDKWDAFSAAIKAFIAASKGAGQ